MASLFRSIVSNKQRDGHFKNEIIKELNNYIKEIQLYPPRSVGKQTTNEVTIALCTTLEALFLHGLKETILSKVSAMASDIINKPECNFWSVALIFSHQEIISNINRLKLITNDIGRCRAWLRIAINDNLLVSYLSMMSAEPKSLVAFYNKTALLRDVEKLDIVISLLTGIMQYEFDLVVNSSLLNVWSDDAVILAGTWSPPMKANPVSSGMDVVQTIKDDIEESLGSKLSLSSFTSGISSYKYPDVSDEEILDKLMRPSTSVPTNEAKYISSQTKTSDYSTNKPVFSIVVTNTDVQNKDIVTEHESNDTELSVKEATHDKLSDENEINTDPVCTEKANESKSQENVPSKKVTVEKVSYKGVLDKYIQENPDSIMEIENGCNIDALLKKFQDKTKAQMPEKPDPSTIPSDPQTFIATDPDFDFEIVDASQLPLVLPDFSHFAQCLSTLTREKGVRSQNYSCKQCSTPIGITFGFLCNFTSEYFCEDCYSAKSSAIPARVIYNWDFTPRPVSGKASVFLSEIHNHPVFNIKLLNPRLYFLVEQMTQVQYLRMRLCHMKGYLLSCKSTANYLQVELWPREYLYESLHLYSLLDLKEIQAGKLQTLLNHVIAYGLKHVASCDVCKLKGHICELCTTSKDIIFPFDLDRTHTCRQCRAVYHKACYKEDCPKCARIRKRQSVVDVREDCDGEREIEVQRCERDAGTKHNTKIPNGAISLHVGSPSQKCDMYNDNTDDSVSVDESPVHIECTAEVHSVQSR